jgi:hypothetical protein
MNTKRLAILMIMSLLLAGNALAETFQVRHDHIVGSCKGELTFNDTSVEYSTGRTEHARVWKYEDIQQLEIAPGRSFS